MKRLLSCIFLVSLILNGCSSDKQFTRDTAEAKVLNHLPQCGNSLQTFNTITDTKQTDTGYIFTIRQNCEPKNGEGPRIETLYSYSVTPDDVSRLKE